MGVTEAKFARLTKTLVRHCGAGSVEWNKIVGFLKSHIPRLTLMISRIDMNKSFSKLVDHLVKKARNRMLEVAGGRDIVDKLRLHVELLECIKASMQGDEGSWATSKKLEREWVAQKASHRRALYPKEEELKINSPRLLQEGSQKFDDSMSREK